MVDSFAYRPQVAPEVLAYLDDKGLRPGFSWLDVWGEEHAHAFTVAKAMELDVLDTIKGEIRRSLDEGQTFEAFRDQLQPKLEKLGWWGRKEMTDPATGETSEVQLGSPRRLKVMYEANVRSARAAGQWERIERTKALLPYLLYTIGPSERHRPHHVDKAGLVLPVDDPFWDVWMGPNGWGCKCGVRQLSRGEANERGISKSPDVPTRPYVNRRSGEVTDIPVGIDPGWQTNPGKARMNTLLANLSEKLETAGEDNARAAIAGLWREAFARAFANTSRGVAAPVGVAPAAQAALGARSPLVAVYNTTVRAKAVKHAAITPGRFDLVAQILDRGTIVDQGKARARSVWAEIDGRWWKLVLRISEGGYLRVQTLHPSSRAQMARARGEGGR